MAFINISFGSVEIPFKEVINSILGRQTVNETWQYIILNYRLPKVMTAILVGASLTIR